MSAREALAESLANEFNLDMTPELMEQIDRILIALFLWGYGVFEWPS